MQPSTENIDVETEVIQTMRKQGYTLNTVNNYGENLLHISAANGCLNITGEILNSKENCLIIDRKNAFGWTALMQAVRNGNFDTVKLLLEKGANVKLSTYLGMSVYGLAAAMGEEMFIIVYKQYPKALLSVMSDDITPVCVAAMKNDKNLFFKLLELGLSDANEYTQIMMRCSTVPEIVALAKDHLSIDDYWNDTSDNIEVMDEENLSEIVIVKKEVNCPPDMIENLDCDIQCEPSKSVPIPSKKGKRKRPNNLLLLPIPKKSAIQDLISPNLTYNTSDMFVASPTTCFTRSDFKKYFKTPLKRKAVNMEEINNLNSIKLSSHDKTTSTIATNNEIMTSNLDKYPVNNSYQLCTPPMGRERLQSSRLADFNLSIFADDLNTTLDFTPEFSPLKSPHVHPDLHENVFGENTPTPPRCKTPPPGTLLRPATAKLIVAMHGFGISEYLPLFLQQEVDFDLFLTLTYDDLREIGVVEQQDRFALLKVIDACKQLMLML